MSSLASKLPPSIDRDALLRAIEPVVHAHGAELVDIEYRPEPRSGWVLRLYVEKEGASANALSTRDAAVSLDLCADVSRDLSASLDAVDLIPHAYQLEVSSPGVERPLRTERDFTRFAGQRVRVKRHLEEGPGMGGDRVVVGVLNGLTDGKVAVAEGKRIHEIPLDTIESARLVFEFGPARPPSAREHGRIRSRNRTDSAGDEPSRSQRKH